MLNTPTQPPPLPTVNNIHLWMFTNQKNYEKYLCVNLCVKVLINCSVCELVKLLMCYWKLLVKYLLAKKMCCVKPIVYSLVLVDKSKKVKYFMTTPKFLKCFGKFFFLSKSENCIIGQKMKMLNCLLLFYNFLKYCTFLLNLI